MKEYVCKYYNKDGLVCETSATFNDVVNDSFIISYFDDDVCLKDIIDIYNNDTLDYIICNGKVVY